MRFRTKPKYLYAESSNPDVRAMSAHERTVRARRRRSPVREARRQAELTRMKLRVPVYRRTQGAI